MISSGLCVQGRQAHSSIRINFEDGRTLLTKHNLVKMMWRKYTLNLAPLDVPPDILLLWILKFMKYIPAATRTLTPAGYGLHLVQLQVIFYVHPASDVHPPCAVIHSFTAPRCCRRCGASSWILHGPHWP